MRVVVDHVSGTRRGERQELAASARVRFGRHPDCEVSFDPHHDIDASSRHAELRPIEQGWVLVDLGSSNGTYVQGRRITEAPIDQNNAVIVEFGSGGPCIRLFVGDDAAIERLPPPPVARQRPAWLVPVAAGLALLVVLVIVLARC